MLPIIQISFTVVFNLKVKMDENYSIFLSIIQIFFSQLLESEDKQWMKMYMHHALWCHSAQMSIHFRTIISKNIFIHIYWMNSNLSQMMKFKQQGLIADLMPNINLMKVTGHFMFNYYTDSSTKHIHKIYCIVRR